MELDVVRERLNTMSIQELTDALEEQSSKVRELQQQLELENLKLRLLVDEGNRRLGK